jgi:hypothetical protein
MTPPRERSETDRRERVLRIDEGRVVCPRRGRVDIARCWECPDYRGLTTGRVEALVCSAFEESIASAAWSGRDEPTTRD